MAIKATSVPPTLSTIARSLQQHVGGLLSISDTVSMMRVKREFREVFSANVIWKAHAESLYIPLPPSNGTPCNARVEIHRVIKVRIGALAPILNTILAAAEAPFTQDSSYSSVKHAIETRLKGSKKEYYECALGILKDMLLISFREIGVVVAAQQGHTEVITTLLAHGPIFEGAYRSAIIKAYFAGHRELVKSLISMDKRNVIPKEYHPRLNFVVLSNRIIESFAPVENAEVENED